MDVVLQYEIVKNLAQILLLLKENTVGNKRCELLPRQIEVSFLPINPRLPTIHKLQ